MAKAHRVPELKVEVRRALESGRRVPRKGTYGLRNSKARWVMLLDKVELAILRKGLQKEAARMRAKREKEGPAPTDKDAILSLCKKVLERDGDGDGMSERRRSIYDLVFTVCEECREKHHLLTDDGPVEVSPEYIEGIQGEARKMRISLEEQLVKGEAVTSEEIAGDVPVEVQEKVLASHDHSCAYCGETLDLHVHHIVFRTCGGTNHFYNLLPCCSKCHSCVHEGSLEVFRDSMGRLY